MKLLTLLFVFHCGLVAQTQFSSTSAASGVLIGEDGSLIAGARVELLLQSPPSQGKGLQTFWGAYTGADESFRFSGLKGASYKICAETAGSAWLNLCEWGLNPSTLTLASQQTASINVALKKGVAVTIRIDDPNRWLAQYEGKAPGAHLLIGVPTAAFSLHAASLQSQDSAGRTYQAVIPFNYPAVVVVRSAFFQLSNASGVALPTGATVPITVAAGQPASPLSFTVTGGGQ